MEALTVAPPMAEWAMPIGHPTIYPQESCSKMTMKFRRNTPCAFAVCGLLWIWTACTTGNTGAPLNPEARALVSEPKTYVYECDDGYRFIARIEGERARLFLAAETVDLPHAPAASGARYSNGRTTFWSKGDKAMLQTGQEMHPYCRNNRAKAIWEHAKLNGVEFRAVGNEPGWYLEISPNSRGVIVSDYGKTRFEIPLPEPKIDLSKRATTYRVQSGGHSMEIVIEDRPCRDAMSGEPFESTVRWTLDDREHRGCGRALH